jgi:hypothetical protein
MMVADFLFSFLNETVPGVILILSVVVDSRLSMQAEHETGHWVEAGDPSA